MSSQSSRILESPEPQEWQLWLFQLRNSWEVALTGANLERSSKGLVGPIIFSSTRTIHTQGKKNKNIIRSLALLNKELMIELHLFQQKSLSGTSPFAPMGCVWWCTVRPWTSCFFWKLFMWPLAGWQWGWTGGHSPLLVMETHWGVPTALARSRGTF